MSFRTRLFIATSLAVLVPLTVLALGIRREMDRRLSDESRHRGEAALESLRAEVEREHEGLLARLAALAADLARENRFRLAAVQGDPASRSYLLDWGGTAMRLSGLGVLQLQDSAGRILSSGHFRNEYDQLRPELPQFLAAAGRRPALARVRTAESPLLALAAAEPFTVAGRRFVLVGGTAAEERFLQRLDPDPELAVTLDAPGTAPSSATGADSIGSLTLPFLDALQSSGADSVRLVVTRTSGTLAALRRGLNTWFLVSLAVTTMLAVLLAAWLSRRISRPLTDLAEKTAAIDLDRLDQDFATDREDEIGALSRLLGAMTARLRAGAARLRDAERRIAMGDLARQVNHDIKNGFVPIRNVLRHFDEVAQDRAGDAARGLRRAAGHARLEPRLPRHARAQLCRLSPAARREACDVNAVVDGGRPRDPPAPATVRPGSPAIFRPLPPTGWCSAASSRTSWATRWTARRRTTARSSSRPSLARDGRGAAVRITIADTGPGMTRAELDRAFDDFYTTKAGGTGLGLSIVRRLVVDLGGAMRMETEPGAGTRAIVELPAAVEEPR